SVRSEVQVFPGPPLDRVRFLLEEKHLNDRREHSSSGYGAIAQLGERVLCKHEVVGSIPSGSTSLRRLRLLRLGKPDRGEGCHAEARKSEGGPSFDRPVTIVRENITSHFASLTRERHA